MSNEDDLNVKLVGKEEKFWLELRDKLEGDNESMVRQMDINSLVVGYCCKKLDALKEKV